MSKARQLAQKPSQPTGRKNLIINGGMGVYQRSTSETGLGASSGYFTADRWKIDSNTAGRVTMAEDTSDTPAGFGSALKITTTTADTSVAAGEYFVLQQGIEGQNLQQLRSGTSGAKEFTVSFYVKGNAAATYMLEMQDLDNAEVNGQQFSVTTSWTRVELTFNSDTSNAFGNDNGNSLELKLWLHAGSNFTSGTYSPNSWYSNGTSANRAVGIDSIMDSTSRTLSITGVQLEVGSTATEFEHRSYAEELYMCKRYFRNDMDGRNGACSNTTTRATWHIHLDPEMRARPTASLSTGSTFPVDATFTGNRTFTPTAFDYPAGNTANFHMFRVYGNLNSALTVGQSIMIDDNHNIEVDAEL